MTIDEVPVAMAPTLVTQIESFLASDAGQLYKDAYILELDARMEHLLHQPVDANYTPFTREGFIGEVRQLKLDSVFLERLRAQLVENITEHQIQQETNE
jgi:hypothetical protein|tara:strand:- start:445 stop:741 length:297 start_codon:yes stop_codon:yes gene_type:complete